MSESAADLRERLSTYYEEVGAAARKFGSPKELLVLDGVIRDVAMERALQNAKWGRTWCGWKDPNGLKLAVLLEEVGEVQLRDELIQVAAVAVAWAEMLPRRA